MLISGCSFSTIQRRSERVFVIEVFFEPIHLDLQLADGFIELFTFLLIVALGFLDFFAFRKDLRCFVEELSLPLDDLIWMKLMLLGELCEGEPSKLPGRPWF